MTASDSPLTSRQGVTLVSRALAVYFLYCAVANLLNLPLYVHGLLYYWRYRLAHPAADTYYLHDYQFETITSVLRLIAEFCISAWFYKSGPAIARFLTAAEPEDPPNAGPSPHWPPPPR